MYQCPLCQRSLAIPHLDPATGSGMGVCEPCDASFWLDPDGTVERASYTPGTVRSGRFLVMTKERSENSEEA